MFVPVLKIKSYIAAVLNVIFLAKFAAIEANGLNVIFSETATTFVNPYCKKSNSNDKSNESASLSALDHVETQVIILSGNCMTPRQIDLLSCKMEYSEPNTAINEHFKSKLSYRYLDSISLPPLGSDIYFCL